MTDVCKKILFSLCLVFLWICLPATTLAADFKTDYQVEYFLTDNHQQDLQTHVRFSIVITNLRSDVYVKKFSLAFPASFQISNIVAGDDAGPVTPEIVTDNDKNRIDLEFSHPQVGRDSRNAFQLEFDQNKLFEINGNVWEVIIPTLENKDAQSTYSVIVDLPSDTDKKISIAKPKPTLIKAGRIFWNNPDTKTIYAVFGDTQYYETKITYNLENPRFGLVYTDVAFPPDTPLQKIYINSIDPAPDQVNIDSDGNYIGRYYLKPKENKVINYRGVIQVGTKIRPEVASLERNAYPNQLGYLHDTNNQYWQISNFAPYNQYRTPEAIYNYVVDHLSYNYSRVSNNIKRLGAQAVLDNPKNAVCSEFSDLFVAMSRRQDIAAREIQGYGFTSDNQLRPISLTSDILHSWPQYYDRQDQLWINVDPTWENTSGIDYLHSFDLNHIVFAIHGKSADYPYPAGMYKIGDSHDLSIKPVSSAPKEEYRITLDDIKIPKQLSDRGQEKAEFTVKNAGNTYVYALPVSIQSDNLLVSPSQSQIVELAPLQTNTLTFTIASRTKNQTVNAYLSINVRNQTVFGQTVKVSPYYVTIAGRVGGVIIAFAAVVFVFRYLFGRKNYNT